MKEQLKMYDLVYHCGDLFIYCGDNDNGLTFIESINRTTCNIHPQRLPIGYVSKATNTYFGYPGLIPDGPKLSLHKLKKHNPESIYAMLTSSDKDSFNLALEILKIEGVI